MNHSYSSDSSKKYASNFPNSSDRYNFTTVPNNGTSLLDNGYVCGTNARVNRALGSGRERMKNHLANSFSRNEEISILPGYKQSRESFPRSSIKLRSSILNNSQFENANNFEGLANPICNAPPRRTGGYDQQSQSRNKFEVEDKMAKTYKQNIYKKALDEQIQQQHNFRIKERESNSVSNNNMNGNSSVSNSQEDLNSGFLPSWFPSANPNKQTLENRANAGAQPNVSTKYDPRGEQIYMQQKQNEAADYIERHNFTRYIQQKQNEQTPQNHTGQQYFMQQRHNESMEEQQSLSQSQADCWQQMSNRAENLPQKQRQESEWQKMMRYSENLQQTQQQESEWAQMTRCSENLQQKHAKAANLHQISNQVDDFDHEHNEEWSMGVPAEPNENQNKTSFMMQQQNEVDIYPRQSYSQGTRLSRTEQEPGEIRKPAIQSAPALDNSDSSAPLLKQHVSQTAAQRPPERLIKNAYKTQLQTQIDERKRKEDERIILEKAAEEKLQRKIKEDQEKMKLEYEDEKRQQRLKEEIFNQGQEVVLKRTEELRKEAEQDRERQRNKKRSSISLPAIPEPDNEPETGHLVESEGSKTNDGGGDTEIIPMIVSPLRTPLPNASGDHLSTSKTEVEFAHISESKSSLKKEATPPHLISNKSNTRKGRPGVGSRKPTKSSLEITQSLTLLADLKQFLLEEKTRMEAIIENR